MRDDRPPTAQGASWYEPEPAPAPAMLGRYQLGLPIGGGPTGEVFRAKLVRVGGAPSEFAIKCFYPTLIRDAHAREVIVQAAREYASLEHPGIGRLHELGTADDVIFAAVELVPGIDLGRCLAASSRLPPGAVLDVITRLARALGYAHGRGVCHGGICPTNVIITTDGDPKLVDFGFLRARLPARPAEDVTLAARLPYLAPEQLLGRTATSATDVFQLAILAYELLTGERAFAGGDRDKVAARILAGTPPDVPLPASLKEVLWLAMSSNVEERYPDGAAFARALDATVKRMRVEGGRRDVAEAAERAIEEADDLFMRQISGALTLPLPAPPPEVPPDLSAPKNVFDDPTRRYSTQPGRAPPPRPPLKRPTPAVDVRPSARGTAPPALRRTPPPIPAALGTNPPARRRTPPPMPPPRPAPWAARPLATPPPSRPAPPQPPSVAPEPPRSEPPVETVPKQQTPKRSSAAIVVAGIACAGGLLLFWPRPDPIPSEAKPAPPAPAPVEPPKPEPPPEPELAPVPAVTTPASDAGALEIESEPKGALVYLDGVLKGRTPLRHEGSGDRHRLALILPRHEMYRAEVDGHGRVSATLARVRMLRGEAGLRVIDCKEKDRFYVIVDGVESGQICPSDRIHMGLGTHQVEIYDPVTDTTTSHEVNVESTRRSARLRIDD